MASFSIFSIQRKVVDISQVKFWGISLLPREIMLTVFIILKAMCKLLYVWDNPGLYWWCKSEWCADGWHQIDKYQTFKVHVNVWHTKIIYLKMRDLISLMMICLIWNTFIFVHSFKWYLILKAHWWACNYSFTKCYCLILFKWSLDSWTKSQSFFSCVFPVTDLSR